MPMTMKEPIIYTDLPNLCFFSLNKQANEEQSDPKERKKNAHGMATRARYDEQRTRRATRSEEKKKQYERSPKEEVKRYMKNEAKERQGR